MPYYAVFGTPLGNPFGAISGGSEYSAELDADTDDDAFAEAERHFQPHLLAIHWYPSRDRSPMECRTLIDYQDSGWGDDNDSRSDG